MKWSDVAMAVVRVLVLSVVALVGSGVQAGNLGNVSASQALVESYRDGDVVSILLSQFGSRLVLVGHIDGLTSENQVILVGQRVVGPPEYGVAVGDYFAVIGRPAADAVVESEAVYSLTELYVPGASQVLIRGDLSSDVWSIGRTQIGSQGIDLTPLMSGDELGSVGEDGAVAAVIGIQPLPGGVLLARSFETVGTASGSLGSGKTSGSLATGKVRGAARYREAEK